MRMLGIVGRQDFFGGGEYNLDLRGFGATADNNQVVVVDGLRVNEADLGGTRVWRASRSNRSSASRCCAAAAPCCTARAPPAA